MKKRITLTFPRSVVQTPVTYLLAKEFNVAANIIKAQVAPNQVGKLVLELSGDIDQLDAAIDWMKSNNIDVSYTTGQINIDETVCVHCSLCTGVCPTESLIINSSTYKLEFRQQTCIVCEQCIPTCPVQAITSNI